jgi:hypothetical protein
MGEKYFTGKTVWSLKGLERTIEQISMKSIEFHIKRRDMEKWAENSLHDKTLARELMKVRADKLEGEQLRKTLVKLLKKKRDSLEIKTESASSFL